MPQLCVPARALPPYAEFVPLSRLTVGHVYFRVSFKDQKLLVPSLTPVVFLGSDLTHGDRGVLYFKDLESSLDGVQCNDAARSEPPVLRFLESESTGVFDYERALDELLRCSLRRQEDAVRSD